MSFENQSPDILHILGREILFLSGEFWKGMFVATMSREQSRNVQKWSEDKK